MSIQRIRLLTLTPALALLCHPLCAEPPQAGRLAPEFRLASLRGGEVSLEETAARGPVALVVLRGWPGYQCPICNRQVREFLARAEDFRKANAQVVLVYPGPPADLDLKAKEFMADKELPAHFHLVLDPDYRFTNLYSLRWKAPRETAYPAAFVIGRGRKIRFAKVSDSHAGRASAAEVLAALAAE